MSIILDHITLPAFDHEASAKLFAEIMGLPYNGPVRHFAPVRVNDRFTLDFYKAVSFKGYHLGFHIGEDDFDAIFSRLQSRGICYGNDPREPTNMRTDHLFGGRGLYFMDPNGHLIEIMTKVAAS
jgi:catechol 2,3-dioxygenase-like lactoylglutathione lyase family enzyme